MQHGYESARMHAPVALLSWRYQNAASPALLTTALKLLQFTPGTGAPVAPMLTLTVTDPTTQSTASSVIGAVLPTVSDATRRWCTEVAS